MRNLPARNRVALLRPGRRPRMIRELARLGAALGVGCALLACERAERVPPPDLVATVGSDPVRYEAFAAHLATNLGEEAGTLAAETMSRLFDQYLDEELLARLARDRRLAPPGIGARQAADALLASATVTGPSHEELAGYYEAHRADFERPERVRLRQILVGDRRLATQARRQLIAGVPFAEVIRELGDDEVTAIDDGGELAREDLPPAFVDQVFALAAGETSEVIQADYGFHVFQVLARYPAQLIPFEQAVPEIRSLLSRIRADRQLEELLAEARARYPVTVVAGNLPFTYQGIYVTSPS